MQVFSEKYQLVVGLEVHAQLNTQSKIFAPESKRFGESPNSQVSVISLAHPGTLPKLNEKALESAIKMGLACHCQIQSEMYFDRKNYFYPDLPKAYQLSQDKTPICMGGRVIIRNSRGQYQSLELHHIHLEEDAGKSIHPEGQDYSIIDFNRAGTPLIEIVTNPVLHSSEEAYQMLFEIRRLVRFLDICDGNMEEGSLRCDANVSVRPHGQETLGTRVEIKNMNSLRHVRKAIDYEFERQCQLLENAQTFPQETRTFDANLGKTFSMREKENLNDYRYFPEPDLSPIHIASAQLAQIQASLPLLPLELEQKYQESYGLSFADARQLSEEADSSAFFEELCQLSQDYKNLANWMNGEIRAWKNEQGLGLEEFPIPPAHLVDLLSLIKNKEINRLSASSKLFPMMLQKPQVTVAQLLKEMGLEQVDDQSELKKLIQALLLEMPDKVKAYKKGKKGLEGMFMGLLMKRTQGKADPQLSRRLLQEALETAQY